MRCVEPLTAPTCAQISIDSLRFRLAACTMPLFRQGLQQPTPFKACVAAAGAFSRPLTLRTCGGGHSDAQPQFSTLSRSSAACTRGAAQLTRRSVPRSSFAVRCTPAAPCRAPRRPLSRSSSRSCGTRRPGTSCARRGTSSACGRRACTSKPRQPQQPRSQPRRCAALLCSPSAPRHAAVAHPLLLRSPARLSRSRSSPDSSSSASRSRWASRGTTPRA